MFELIRMSRGGGVTLTMCAFGIFLYRCRHHRCTGINRKYPGMGCRGWLYWNSSTTRREYPRINFSFIFSFYNYCKLSSWGFYTVKIHVIIRIFTILIWNANVLRSIINPKCVCDVAVAFGRRRFVINSVSFECRVYTYAIVKCILYFVYNTYTRQKSALENESDSVLCCIYLRQIFDLWNVYKNRNNLETST